MDVLAFLFGFAIFLFLFAALGHVLWLMGAAVFRVFRPSVDATKRQVTPTAESDLWETAEALQRMLYGRLIDADEYRSMRDSLEEVASRHSIPLPIAVRTLPTMPEASVSEVASVVGSGSSVMDVPPILAEPVLEEAKLAEPHALDRDYEQEPAPMRDRVAVATRRTLGDMLQQFLNEKNIQWGELISGLLIIGSAVGLILSLRTELNRVVPMFPALLFFAVTVTIHLAGFYTFKRWKLPSTSRGILLIGSLMIPISALAACLLADHGGSASLWEWSLWIPILVGGATFAYLSLHAGRQMYPDQPLIWMLAVVPSALAMGFINRTGEAYIYFWTFAAIASSSIASLLAVVVGLHWHSKREVIDEHDPAILRRKWKLIGVAALSAITALGLTVFRAKDREVESTLYAIPSSVWGCVLIMLGSHLLIESRKWRSRIATNAAGIHSTLSIASELGGASIVMLGALASVFALALSAQSPNLLLLIASVNLALSIVALMISRHVMLTVSAAINGSVVIWLGTLLLTNALPDDVNVVGAWDWSWILRALQLPASAWILLSLGVIGLCASFAMSAREKLFSLASQGDRENLSEQSVVQWSGRFDSLSHSSALLSIGACYSVVSFVLAFQLGWTGQSLFEVVSGAIILGLFALALSAAGLRMGQISIALVGSLAWLMFMATVVRENSEIGRLMGIQSQGLEARVVIGLLGHSVLVGIVSFAVSLLAGWLKRSESRVESIACRDRYYYTGLTTASLTLLSLLQWDRVNRWGWDSLGFVVIAFLYGLGQYRLRTTLRSEDAGLVGRFWSKESVDQPFEQIAVGAIALGLAKLVSFWLHSSSNLACTFSASYSWLLSLVGLFYAGYWMLRSSKASSSVSRSFYFGDCLAVALLVYHGCHFVGSVMVWNTLSGQGLRIESMLWMSSSLISLAALIWLSLQRAAGYEWLAGLQSAICMFLGLYLFAPPSSSPVNLFYLMAASPLIVVLALSIVSTYVDRHREGALRSKWRPDYWLFRDVISWGAVFAWLAITLVTWMMHLDQLQSKERGLLELGGVVWYGVGVVAIVYRWLALPNTNRSMQVFAATAVPWLQLPIVMKTFWAMAIPASTMLLVCCISAALHTLVWSLFAWRGARLREWLQVRLGMGVQGGESTGRQAICGLIWIVLGLCFVGSNGLGWNSVQSDQLRMTALATFLIGFALLSTERIVDWSEECRWRLRLLAVSCGTLFVVWFAWSGIAAESMPLSDLLLHRLLRLSVVSVVVAMALSWTLARTTSRIPEAWRSVLRRQWSILAAWSAVAILVSIILLRESYRATGARSAYSAEVLCILLALMLWMVQWVVQALRDSWNVARLEDRWKELYVYAAEACLVMGLGLAYAQFSEWFELPFREYWPIGLLLVAVASQGVATMVRRAGILAISNPLQNTSLVLPLLASMGVLFIAADVKADVVFLLSAFFYFAMGAADGSRRFAVLGVTFANIALALFWNRIPSLDFAEHPQLWVIPPAVSVLAATHVYRNQWKAEVTTWIRYLAVLTIFMSSTFEVLIVGFGKQLWPPMILMVLSVLTVFLGMVLRVRSYLFSGVLFLLVSVTSMVAHAQQSLQHTWPWWVLGISLGTGILVLYGVFEKKREQFRELSDQLRRWQP